MKKDIHPKFKKVKAKCACGNEFMTSSTAEELRVEVCSQCHPHWSGKNKLVDAAGRVDKFNRKYGLTS